MELWAVLLFVVLVVGLVGRKKFSPRTKLWLWRVALVLASLYALGNQRDVRCRSTDVNYAACMNAPFTVLDLVEWVVSVGILYALYRFATRKLRRKAVTPGGTA